MNRYGQSIVWGPLSAPAIFTGDIVSYSYADAVNKQSLPDAVGDLVAMALTGQKAEINFEAEVTPGSVDFLDLSAGAALAVDGITGGTILASRAVEKWALLRRKTASIQATHFPDMTPVGTPAMAGTELSANTPDQTTGGILLPGSTLVFSTIGLTHASGLIHELTLIQTLKIVEDDLSPDGKIKGAATNGYERSISLLLLADPTAAKPAVKSTLVLTGGPSHSQNYKITHSELRLEREKGRMYSVEAAWIPPFTV